MKFSGKATLVAGSGGGVGLEIANQLIKRGVNVCLADVKPEPDKITDGPGKSIYIQTDLTEQNNVEQVTRKTKSDQTLSFPAPH